ncbi:ABC transporter ATP-binding protein [Aestuariivirga sp.]|uniref:ABC transporter ATP-binding protein n=1 Tax=Aestuariivirga sp. TaxID=2650926 RepID=UPI0039E4D747
MASISLKKVTKAWGSVVGVDGIDLEIKDKEFIVFLGPSGCGKTTTMRMVAGLEDPTGGDILIDGERVNDVDARDRDVAMVFQSYALYPNMSIYENIRFPLRMRNVPNDQQEKMVREAAAMVELGDYLDRKPKALSGGQRQRAALARAIVRHPRVFLMDEPLSNLDAKLRLTMRAQLKHIQKRLQTTTIYVTHDQIEAMTLADRVAIMDKGRIQQLGTPDEVYNDPANVFVAGFIGSTPMNLIKGNIENGAFVGSDVKVPKVGKGNRANVTIGIRPEDVSVVKTGSGHLNSKVYSIEPTGDQTLLAVDLAGKLVIARADRNFRQAIDTPVSLNFDPDRIYLFDTATGLRIRD